MLLRALLPSLVINPPPSPARQILPQTHCQGSPKPVDTVQCQRSVNLLCCGKLSYNPAAVFQSLNAGAIVLQVVSEGCVYGGSSCLQIEIWLFANSRDLLMLLRVKHYNKCVFCGSPKMGTKKVPHSGPLPRAFPLEGSILTCVFW